MYCSIEEAWPTHQLNSLKRNNDYIKDVNQKEKNEKEKPEKEKTEDDITEHFTNNYNKYKILNNQCDLMLNHISNCDDCLKKIYKKYNCSKNNNNILSELITNENKDMILVVFIGIVVILILQLFTSID